MNAPTTLAPLMPLAPAPRDPGSHPLAVLTPQVQWTIAAIAAVVLVVVGTFLLLMWRRGRSLHAGHETLRQYWRGLEKALVDHHQAAEDVVRKADATGALRRREREQVEAAVASATLTGTPSQRARREAVLHSAAQDLAEILCGRPAAQTPEVSQALADYDEAWEHVETLGQRYTSLVVGYNRLVQRPVLRWWNKRLGWHAAQPFESHDDLTLGTRVDVL